MDNTAMPVMQPHNEYVETESVSSRLDMTYWDEDIMIFDNISDLKFTNSVKTRLGFILICMEGSSDSVINAKTYHLEKGDVLFSQPRVNITATNVSPNFACKAITISEQMIQQLLSDKLEVFARAVYLHEVNKVTLNEVEACKFFDFYRLINSRIDDHENPMHKRVMHSIIQAMLMEFCGILEMQTPKDDESYSQGRIIFNRFLSILNHEEPMRHPVSYYSDKLAVSAKYLSTVCERYSGKTAAEWMRTRICEEITFCLRNTALSIKEISNKLGFSNVSFFGTYVRKNFGASPRKYRATLQKGLALSRR